MTTIVSLLMLMSVMKNTGSVMLNATNLSDEHRLLRHILHDYDRTVRPRYDSKHQVTVETRFSLQQIYDLDEKRQILSISGWLTAEWTDELLTWAPEDYGGLMSVVVNPRSIWTPKMAIGNSARKMFEDWRHFYITVRHDGRARWQPGGIFTFSCALDINFYPFDEQICTMELETWYYTSDMVNMTISMETFGLETYLENGEWAVVNTDVRRKDQIYHYYDNEAFPEVYLTIHMRRKYVFYFLYILLPCMMLSCVLLMMFVLPAESGEKVSLGVALLVSFCVFLLIVSEQVPDTSDAVPIIALYLMYFMLTTSLSVMAAAAIVKIHYSAVHQPLPHWLKVVTFSLLARVMCLKDATEFIKRHQHCRHTGTNDDKKSSTTSRDLDSSPSKVLCKKVSPFCDHDLVVSLPYQHETDNCEEVGDKCQMSGACCRVGGSCCHLGVVSSDVGVATCELGEMEYRKAECRMAASILDHFFFWLFLAFLCVPITALICLTKIYA